MQKKKVEMSSASARRYLLLEAEGLGGLKFVLSLQMVLRKDYCTQWWIKKM